LSVGSLNAATLPELTHAFRSDPRPAAREALIRFASAHKDTDGALAWLALGIGEIEHQQQIPEALRHLDSASQRLPSLRDYPAFFTATGRLQLAQYADVQRALSPVWSRTPTSPLVARSVYLQANALLGGDQAQAALAFIEKHLADISKPGGELLLTRAAEALDDSRAAQTHAERIFTDYPLAPEAADAEAALQNYPALSPDARYRRCVKLIEGGDYGRARRELTALLPVMPPASLGNVRLKLAQVDVQTKAYQKAYDALRILKVTAREADAERLFLLVRCARRLDHPDQFNEFLDHLAQQHPQSRWRLEALLAAADYYYVQNDIASYEPLYRTCAESFPSEPQAAECQWKVAWTEYFRRSPKAGTSLEAFVERYPGSEKVPAALYFLARLAETKKDWASARADYDAIAGLYPNYFYATLAREKLTDKNLLHAAPAAAEQAWLESVALPKDKQFAGFEPSKVTKERIERARLLVAAGLDDFAEAELQFGGKHDGQPQVIAVELAELNNLHDSPDKAIRYIKQLAPNYLSIPLESAPERFWKLAFPLPFRDSLEQYCRERSLDPFLVAALIRQESEFNPKVISHANAYGLTQVLPSTGREISRRLNLRGFRPDMLFTPETNLQIGTYFLRSLFDRLQGSWEAALASYNAGPSRVARWLHWGEFREPAEFIETIPFNETRNYVQSVLRNAELYRRLYGPKPVALASSNGDIRRKESGPSGNDRKPAAAFP
jgi:soluble lytic murein transglycosylase